MEWYVVLIVLEIIIFMCMLGMMALAYWEVTELKMDARKAIEELESKSEEIKEETEQLSKTVRVEVSDSVLDYLDKTK